MSTISQNNIVVNYVITSDQIAKTKTEFDKLTDAEKKAVDETKKLNDSLKKTGQEGGQSVKNVGNEMNNLSGIVKSGAGLLAGFFALSAIKSFGQSVFNVTAEFEKMQAVLKNTLGSNSAAMLSMEAIKKFAQTTPFSVQELTASFIKLANQGFKPNIDQMKKLGDLASSTGKSFDQLAEAIIDAQVGEFERLKEFGVRAQKEGENVRFTFKGVETQVKNNNASIREYIVSLGDLNGVSGSAAAISETLGGKVNNLGDAWDNFLNKIGTLLKPVLTEALTVTADFMGKINDLFGGAKSDAERFGVTELETYKAYQKSVLSLTDDQLVSFVAKQKDNLNKAQNDFIKYSKKTADLDYLTIAAAKINVGQKWVVDALKAQEAANQDIAAAKGRIAAAEEQINLREKATATTIEKKVELTDAELKALKAQYDLKLKLLQLEFTQEKLRNQLAGFDAPQTRLRAEEKFLKNKFALQKQYGDLGVGQLKEESQTTSLERQIVSKELERTLKTDTLQIKGYSESVKQFEKDQTENAKKSGIETEKARKASMDQTVKDNKEMIDTVNKEADDLAKKEFDRIKAIEQARQEANQQAFDLAVFSTNAIFDIQSQYAANDFARKQKQFDEEIRLADGNIQKETEINEKRAAAEKEYRLKEFRANQVQSVANAVFAAAPYIIKYSAGLPVTAANLSLTLFALAAQTTAIMAQPPPEFAEGTKGKKYKGRAIVGERGTEKVVTQSGRVYYTPPVATLAQFDEPVEIIPNHQLGLNDRKQLSLIYGNRSTTSDSGGKIIEKLSNIEIGLKNMPVAAISLDERGFMKKVRTPNRSTTILNNRFKN